MRFYRNKRCKMTDRLPQKMIVDVKAFGRVAVLFGGSSAEREISLKSGQAVFDSLIKMGVDAHAIDVGGDVIERLQQGNFDRAFIVLHGRGGEDGVIQGVLEMLSIPYTGSDVRGSALAMDKMVSKTLWSGMGLPTPVSVLVDDLALSKAIVKQLGLPLIIKPASEGSSLGMSKITVSEQFESACERALQLQGRVFAEHWIEGDEYTATILCGQVLPLIRVETPNEFYDFDAKYKKNSTQYHCPCGLDASQEKALQELAIKAFEALTCSGWGRVDFMLDEVGQPWLIEVNTVPGMTDHSLVPMAAAAIGCDFDELVLRILETSVESAQSELNQSLDQNVGQSLGEQV